MTTPPLDRQAAVHLLARDHFEVFLSLAFAFLNPGRSLSRGWYLSAMVKAVEDVAEGRNNRLIVTVPPRHLKSVTISVALPAWLMGRDPTLRILCASYGQDLAIMHARNFRKLIGSNVYAHIFPELPGLITRDTDVEVKTALNGHRYAAGVGGTVTGVGADFIIIDDLMKAQDASFPEARLRVKEFYDGALYSRLEDKASGKIISIQQRLHEDDLVAHLQSKELFHELDLPAIAVKDEVIPLTGGRFHTRRIGEALNPEREPLELLEQMRAEMTSRVFEAQYQQNPNPPESEYVRWDRIQFYDEAPVRARLQKVVHSWDVASSTTPNADYSVNTVWGYDGEAWLLLDLIRVRLSYPDLLARVRLERNRWRADLIIVENASVGPALLEDLARDMRGIGPSEHHAPWCARLKVDPRLSKEERLMSQVERLYSGLAKLPRQAPWLDELRRELLTFPNARYDDQADSLSQFLDYAIGPGGRRLLGRADVRSR